MLTEARPAVGNAARGPSSTSPALLLGALSIALSAVSALLIRAFLPDTLEIRTDIVGYPTFAHFNINRYFYDYYLVALWFPLATVLAFVGLRKATRRRLRLSPSAFDARTHAGGENTHTGGGPATAASTRRLQGLGRAALIGCVLGLEVAIAFEARGIQSLLLVGSSAVAVAGVAAAAGRGTRTARAHLTARERMASVNAVAAPLVILGLLLVSKATEVEVLATAATDRHDWLPWWMAVGGTVVTVAWVVRALQTAARNGTILRVETRVVVVLCGATLLFLATARLPGPVSVDYFHDGEALVPAELVRQGLFPWRDFIFIHGLLNDLIRAAVGIQMFDDSAWGSLAGQAMVLTPLYWFGLYALACRLFPGNGLVLWLVGILIATAAAPYAHYRFLLWPVVLIAFGRLLDAPSWRRCGVFTLLLVVQTVIAPEAGFAALACGGVLIAFELRERPFSRRTPPFLRLRRCGAIGLVVTVSFFLYLAAYGAAGSFLDATLGFARGHRFTGGLPVAWGGPAFGVAMVVPVVVIVAATWYLAALVLKHRPLMTHDWVLAASVLMVAMYYPKFLARADGHVTQVFSVSFPAIMLLASRALDKPERYSGWPWRERIPRAAHLPQMLIGAVLVTVVAAEFSPILKFVTDPSSRFMATAPSVPVAKIGYTTKEATDTDRIADLDRVFGRLVGSGETVFDFSNEPALFHYILGLRPSTRYFHISMAIRGDAQRAVIDELRRRPPRIVVLDANAGGLPAWDGIANFVRHYAVSQYLLDTFQPLLEIHGTILMAKPEEVSRLRALVPSDLLQRVKFEGIGYGYQPCTWGYVPNFLRGSPGSLDRAVTLPVADVGNGSFRLPIPNHVPLSTYRWLQIVSTAGFRESEFMLSGEQDGAAESRVISFRTLPSSRRSFSVRVGSCPAWHAFTSKSLVLRAPAGQTVTAVRLLP